MANQDSFVDTSRALRDERGRFLPGTPHAREVGRLGGRPSRPVEAAYLEAVLGEVPLDAWRVIVARAVADAKAGDPRAREWLSRYVAPIEARARLTVDDARDARREVVEDALRAYVPLLEEGNGGAG